jgi:hypothetical protein
MKTAILQVADTGPLESLVVMLEYAGYKCYIVGTALRKHLHTLGCDSVYSNDSMVLEGSYDKPFPIPYAPIQMMGTADLYVDVKAQRNGKKVWKRWPNLKNKTLWYRINGGEPANIPDKGGKRYGNEIDLPCPIVTPNLWYATDGPWSDKAYAMWPKFVRFDDYYHGRPASLNRYSDPICLVHNFKGWGYHVMQSGMQELGVKIYGQHSPEGMIYHKELPDVLSKSIAMVHLKNNDAPGYALYEALAAGCPLIVSQRLIVKNLMQDMFIDGETCLVFDTMDDVSKVHHSHTEEEITRSVKQVAAHLETLKDPDENIRIGFAGHNMLKKLMWNEKRRPKSDGDSFKQFMERMYGE